MSRGPRSRHPGTGLPSQPPAGSLRLPLHCAPLHRLSGKCPSPGNPPTTKPYLCHQGLYFHCPPHPRTHGLRARGGVLGRPRDTRTHTWRLLPSQRKLGQLRQPGPHRPRGSRPRENNTRRHQDEDPGPGAGVGVLRSRSAPRPGRHKALSGHGLRKGRTQTVHSRPVRGARGGRRGPVPSHPHPHAPRVSLGCPRGAKVLAVSTGERQDACDSGVHKTPSRAWTLGLTSLLGSALPNPRTREPGRAHPAPSSASPVTLPRPLSPLSPAPGASAAGPLGHTSWARPPALSPQVPPRPPPSASAPASAAPGEVVAGPPSQPTSTPGRPRLAWVLGRGSHSTGSASQEPRGSPGGTQPHGAGCNTDPTHLPL